MRRFDYFRDGDSSRYLLVVQSELLFSLRTKVVVPLVPVTPAMKLTSNLQPVFEINQTQYALITNMISAVSEAILKIPVGSLAHKHTEIVDAIDMLFSGV